MNTPYELEETRVEQPIVYVRPVALDSLPDEIRRQVGATTQLYAVHDAAGERLALVRDRRVAFALARQNDMSPVWVN